MSRPPRSTTPAGRPPSGATATIGPRQPRPVAKSTIPKRGPPPALPKKLDYKKPQMTKAMAQRMKHTQALQQEMERKEREKAQAAALRRPRRTAAPVGGDARAGRERRPGTAESRCRAKQRGPCPIAESTGLPPCPASAPTQPPPCPGAAGGASTSRGGQCPRGRSVTAVPSRTRNLAKTMNADIVQAEPLEAGLVDNLIIPPGAINSERTTIVNIPQPHEATMAASQAAGSIGPSASQSQTLANRSVQVINESLNEQDAVEAAVVNSKLQDLQQARRDFVMAVANVGTNAVTIQEDEFPDCNITPIADISPPNMATPEPPSPRLIACPHEDFDPNLQIEYGRHHPVVEAARDYMRGRRRLDDEFANANMQQEYYDACGDDDEPEEVCPSQYTIIPRRTAPYRPEPMVEIDQLERFFDLKNYPPEPVQTPPRSPGPPPGRECLHPDLWDIEDPWYREPSVPDLIDW